MPLVKETLTYELSAWCLNATWYKAREIGRNVRSVVAHVRRRSLGLCHYRQWIDPVSNLQFHAQETCTSAGCGWWCVQITVRRAAEVPCTSRRWRSQGKHWRRKYDPHVTQMKYVKLVWRRLPGFCAPLDLTVNPPAAEKFPFLSHRISENPKWTLHLNLHTKVKV